MSDEPDYRQSWEGRAVSFRELSVGECEPIVDLLGEREGRTAGYLCLALSLIYDDTKERVFDSVDAIRNVPGRLQQRIWWLRMRAFNINGFVDEEPPKTNGHAAAPGPSP